MSLFKNLKSFQLQPGVLTVFRFGIGLEFLFILVIYGVEKFFLTNGESAGVKIPFYVILYLLMVSILVIDKFVKKIGAIAFIIIIFAMTALSYTVPEILKAQESGPLPVQGVILALWITVPLLLVPLTAMAVQTNFRLTGLYLFAVSSIDFGQFLLIGHSLSQNSLQFYFEMGSMLFIRLIALVLIGYILTMVVNSRKRVEVELRIANQRLVEFNEHLENRIAQRTRELSQANEKTLLGWVKVLEMRDFETEGHCERVSSLSGLLARQLEMTDEQTSIIQTGALLHDIGKLSISDSILLKPDKLDEEEWLAMRGHPEFGYQTLHEVEFLEPCLEIVHYHHERWDGGGYPHGLKGKEIPFNARLFSVIDVWDALISDRPYRKAWSPENAQQYICEQAGSQFDPQIVVAFLKLHAELEDKTTNLSMATLPQRSFTLNLDTVHP